MNTKLNIGCWKNIKEGYINLDKEKYEGVDIVWDLEKLPLPFEDNKFEEIEARNILEHIDYIPLMNELFRILKKDGKINIEVPYAFSTMFTNDPTHKSPFTAFTLSYFTKESKMDYLEIKEFSKFKVKLIFEKRILMFWNYVLEPLVNLNRATLNYYERTPLRIFPAHHLKVELIK